MGVPLAGWIIASICSVITAIELYWDTSRRIHQEIERKRSDSTRQQLPFFPTCSWVRMNTQYLLCLLNIWISITTYYLKYFWILLSVSAIALFMIMQLKSVKSNALYLQLKYGSKRNPVGMAIFFISSTMILILCALLNVCMYTNWIRMNVSYPFAIFWNSMLLIWFICHTFHTAIYWRVTYNVVYSDAQLCGSLISFKRMYSYRFSGSIDRALVHFILIVLLIFGNFYGRDYVFYLYIYPICILILQFGNFQSDYRNTIPFPQCCRDWYTNKVSVVFNEAVAAKKNREKNEKEEEKVPLCDL